MNELENALEKYLLELPPNYQRAIKNTPWKQVANKIGLANNLNSDQLAILENEVRMILYALDEAGNFTENLARELSLEQGMAETLTADVIKEVFDVIETEATKTQGVEAQPVTPPPPAEISPLPPPPPIPVEPIAPHEPVIVKKDKKTIIAELAQRVQAAKQDGAVVKPVASVPPIIPAPPVTSISASVPEVAPEIHPMIEPGEVAHEVPHVQEQNKELEIINKEGKPVETEIKIEKVEEKKVEEKPVNAAPQSHYEGGKDPYRESLV